MNSCYQKTIYIFRTWYWVCNGTEREFFPEKQKSNLNKYNSQLNQLKKEFTKMYSIRIMLDHFLFFHQAKKKWKILTDPLCSQEILSLDSLACDVFKVEYIIAYFKAAFLCWIQKSLIFKIQALTWNVDNIIITLFSCWIKQC